MIALTGYLGAGKTTVLNHLLHQPGARIGVIVNDFGEINIDAGLVSGQVDEPASIAGGCLCCLPDAGGLDDALRKLAQPHRALDAIVVEASGIADPESLVRLVHSSRVDRIRPAGVVDVVDAVEYFDTIDISPLPPARFAVVTLVVINKVDRLPLEARESAIARIERRVRERNPRALVVTTTRGRIDPALVFDRASDQDPEDQLPIAALMRPEHSPHHEHADAVSVSSAEPLEPTALVDLLESPPAGVYRMKGRVTVRAPSGTRAYVVNLVGGAIHVAGGTQPVTGSELVAIGLHLDVGAVRTRLCGAIERPDTASSSAEGLLRLERYRRLSE